MILVTVTKMIESNGNLQFFGRAFNEETKESLDYCCAETKHYSLDTCLTRVWFEVGFLARFFGISNEDIKLVNLDDYESSFIVKQLSINYT